jgi:hypothetical protein
MRPVKYKLHVVPIAVALFVCIMTGAWAEWLEDGTAVCTATGYQQSPFLISDGDGGVIAAWEDMRINYMDIYAQRLDGQGTPYWTADGIAICSVAGEKYLSSMIPDGYGGGILVWSDDRDGTNPGFLDELYVQRVDDSGAILWDTEGVAVCSTYAYQYPNPAIASDGTGGAIVAWADHRGVGDDNVYAQRIDASGDTLWNADGIAICTSAGGQYPTDAISDGAGGAIVVWTGSGDIFAQRIDASGDTLWQAGGVPVTGFLSDSKARLVSDGAGGAILAYMSMSGGYYDIYAQRLDSSGNTLWSGGVAICTAAGHQQFPRIVTDGGGGAIITWQDGRVVGALNVYAQRIDSLGVPLWTADGESLCTAAGQRGAPEMVADGDGGAVVAWMDYRNGNEDIYAQRIDGTGVLQWTTDGVPVCTNTEWQENLSVAPDGDGGVVAAWTDARGTDHDIYSLRILASGYSAVGPSVVVTAPNGGELWTPGDTENITWTATDSDGVDSVSIHYSCDNGANYTLVAPGEANDGTYAWTIPDTPTDSALVKVIAYDPGLNEGEDISDDVFVIEDNTPPSVTVTSPNGGEIWYFCGTQNITWTATDASGVDSVSIYYSFNGGAEYTLIASSEANDGTYAWTVPDEFTEEALVKIVAYDPDMNTGEDVSDAVFDITAPSFIEHWMVDSDQVGSRFGFSVSSAGDVNGDGFDEVIVGAPLFDAPESNEGLARVYYGAPEGPSMTADWSVDSDKTSASFGCSVSDAGDVDGDGFDDVIVGAEYYDFDGGEDYEGGAFVYYGSAGGLAFDPLWTANGGQGASCFGHSVSSAGDVNGDGYDDVIVGAHKYDNGHTNEGRAFVFHGSASGLSPTADWTAESDQTNAYFGVSVSGAGDVNGDGYDDVIVGAHGYYNGEGSEGLAFVYYGSASGLSTTADWVGEGNQVAAYFGFSVSGAGDVNDDGYDDVIVGAYGYDDDDTDEGRAFVYHGGPSGLSATADWTAESDQEDAQFAYSVSGAGDLNGDGCSDAIVGAHFYDNGESNEGRVYVYHGGYAGLSATADSTYESDQVGAGFGHCVSSAGDVDGDGKSDVICGAYQYDNCELNEGCAVLYQVPIGTVDVPEVPGRPYIDALFQNYPNPFRAVSGTTILYSVEGSGRAEVRIYDATGRLVRTITDHAEVGENRLHWDGKRDDGGSVPCGVYFCQLKVGGFTSHKKMMLVQ